jgi:hypothetical protein
MAGTLTLPILENYTGAPAPNAPAALTITYTTAPPSGAAAISGVAFEGASPCIGVMGATQMPGQPNFVMSSAPPTPCGVAGFATFGGVGVYGHAVTSDGILGETMNGAAAGVTGRNLTSTGAGI